MADKTEKPTAKKLRDARQQGQIPRSRVLTAGCITVAAGAALLATSDFGTARLRAWTERLLLEQQADGTLLAEGLIVLALLSLPALTAAFLAAFAIGLFTAGFELHAESLAPKLERLNPVEGFKKLFSAKRLIEPARGLVLLAVLGAVGWSEVQESGPLALRAVGRDGAGSLSLVLSLAGGAALRLAGWVLALGAADYAWERFRHLKQLRMSRDEVKREHKDSEGDPHHKAQRKSLHKQLASGGAARGVQKATAVVVNPTHIAVALRYAPDECEAPYLVAKGREEDALAIRREAKALGISIVRDIPLARSLIHYDVGEEIPEELYRAAAAVLKVALEARDSDADSRRKQS